MGNPAYCILRLPCTYYQMHYYSPFWSKFKVWHDSPLNVQLHMKTEPPCEIAGWLVFALGAPTTTLTLKGGHQSINSQKFSQKTFSIFYIKKHNLIWFVSRFPHGDKKMSLQGQQCLVLPSLCRESIREYLRETVWNFLLSSNSFN